MGAEQRRYMDAVELAEYLNISRWMVYKYIKNRQIPYIPHGRIIRFDRIEVDKWIAKRMVKGSR